MKIGYFADGLWSHKALEKILEDERFVISFIVPRYDTQDPVLKEYSDHLNVDYLPIKNVNHADAIDKLTGYGADIFVSMSFNQILKKKILESAPLGFINCHAGALPFYRGRNVLNWVLINDEKEFGVTVHYIDEGIDTGDIILQTMGEITDHDDYSTLLSQSIDLCAELLFNSLDEIDKGTAIRKPQSEIHPVGFYCSRRIDGDEEIDWNWKSRQIFNFIRAISKPGPCARTTLNGNEIVVKKASIVPDAVDYIGIPGEIVGLKDGGLIVKTGDSIIFIKSLSPPHSSKIYRVGTRFGMNLLKKVQLLQERVKELENSTRQI